MDTTYSREDMSSLVNAIFGLQDFLRAYEALRTPYEVEQFPRLKTPELYPDLETFPVIDTTPGPRPITASDIEGLIEDYEVKKHLDVAEQYQGFDHLPGLLAQVYPLVQQAK